MNARELALASMIHDTSWPGELPVGHRLRRKKVNTERLLCCGEFRPAWVAAMGQSSASVWQQCNITLGAGMREFEFCTPSC